MTPGVIILFVLLISAMPLLSKKNRNSKGFTDFGLNVLLCGICYWLLMNGEHIITIVILLVIGSLIIACITPILFKRTTYTYILAGIAILLAAVTWYLIKPSADDITGLLNNDERSITYIEDNKASITSKGDKSLPLASVVKIIVAMEYADQVSEGRLDPEEKIDYKDIEKYYIPNTDGGAQPAFEQAYDTDKLKLEDVAKGMIKFSSNANTDYLIDRLKIDNVNQQMEQLEFKHHSKVYPLSGGMILASQLSKSDLKKEMDEQTLMKRAVKYKDDYVKGKIKEKDITSKLDADRQNFWSDHLTSGSTKEYAQLMNDINNNKFDKDKTKILRTLLEQSDDPAIKKKYEHYGYKGGSTMKVLNGAYYVTDKDGKKKSLAFFLNNLNVWESYKANQSMKAFRDKVLEDEDYRRTLEKELKD